MPYHAHRILMLDPENDTVSKCRGNLEGGGGHAGRPEFKYFGSIAAGIPGDSRRIVLYC
jgi:hypothetical protein